MKISKYIVEVCDNDKFVLYNTANSGTVRVDRELYNKVKCGSIEAFNEAELNFLYDSGIIVDDDYDDKVIADIEKVVLNNGVHLTFITTDDCNFRCPYCYENHNKTYIDYGVYDNILKFLNNTDKDYLSVSWFGGEPTLKMEKIVYFMNKVHSLNKFKSISASITTNGFLLNEKNFSTLINCGVKSFQVTIDGIKEEHDKYRHLKNGNGTFDTIINNLKNIKNTEYDYEFVIRNNYNEDSDLVRYVDYIYSIIGEDKRFKLFFASTGTWSSVGDELPGSCSNSNLRKALARARELSIDMLDVVTNPQTSFCCANFENSYVVNHKGDFLKCTVKLDWDKNIVGHIEDDGKVVFNKNREMWRTIPDLQKCSECNVRPVCMSRYCPHNDYKKCREYKQEKVRGFLRRKYCW